MFIEDKKEIRQAIEESLKAIQDMDVLMEVITLTLVETAREERKVLRADIASRHQERQQYSNLILTYRVNKSVIELGWSEIFRIRGSTTPRYKRVKQSKGVTHLLKIGSGAHEEEVELLGRHEMQARGVHDVLTAYTKARRAFRSLMHAYDKATGHKLRKAANPIQHPDE